MNIKDIRIKNKLNEIIEGNLKNGYVPTSHEVITQITNYVKYNNLALPNYDFTKQPVVAAATFQETNDDVYKDLKIIYDSLINLYLESEIQINKFDTEKKQYDQSIDYLQSILESLVHRYTYNKYSYIENFSNMNMLDMAETTANINIEHKIATLNKYRDLLYTDFDVEVQNATIQTNGEIKNFLDEKGLVWQGTITGTENLTTRLILVIDLKKVTEITRMELSMPLIKPAILTVSYSADKNEWLEISSSTISNKATIHMPQQLRYIQLTIDKDEADKFNTNLYEYYYLVDTIKLFESKYQEESVIITKDIDVDSDISHVTIVPVQSVPPATTAKYSVALNGTTNWIDVPINNGVALNNLIENQSINIAFTKPVNDYLLQHYSINGQNLYNIHTLDSSAAIKEHKLYRGINTWRRRTVVGTYAGIQYAPLFSGTYSHETINPTKPSLVISETVAADEVREYSICLERITQAQTITAPLITSVPVSIYLNGKILYQGQQNAQLSYPLLKGKNILLIIANCAAGTCTLDIGLQFEKYTSRIMGYKSPMRNVSLFDLKYNTNNQTNVYTVYNNMIITKALDTVSQYEFDYSYLKEEVESLKLRLELERLYSETNRTPEIYSIELRCS